MKIAIRSYGGVAFARVALLLISLLMIQGAAFAGERLTVALLPPQNWSGAADSAHWEYTLGLLLKSQLRHIPKIYIPADGSIDFCPDDAVLFASREVQRTATSDNELARRMGGAIKAQWVVWGNYRSEGQRRRLTLYITDVQTGRTSKALIASGSDWFGAIQRARELILANLDVLPTRTQEALMDQRPTRSALALELLSMALADGNHGKPVAEVKINLEKALQADPHFSLALEALALKLAAEGKLAEAEQIARRAVQETPDSARPHYILGLIFLVQNFKTLAREELLDAKRLDPKEPRILVTLSQLYGRSEGKWNEAVALLETAERMAPYIALVHAELGWALANLGSRDDALIELRLAERYDLGTDTSLQASLGRSYAHLGETQRAVERYKVWLAAANKMGIHSADVDDIKSTVAELTARLTPQLVDASPPGGIDHARILARVRAEELQASDPAPPDPMASTPAMARWAREVAGDETNDLERARALFRALSRPVQDLYVPEKTAEQAFEELDKPDVSLGCQDYAFLFVALARQISLKAFYVLVNTNFQNKPVSHACAGVFVGKGALLVDPSCEWFGVPHKDYVFEDDLHAVAFYLGQSTNLSWRRLAVKLAPDSPQVRFNLATALAEAGHPSDARMELEAALKQDRQSWFAMFAQGLVETYETNYPAAMRHLQVSLAVHPDFPLAHYYLAEAYRLNGDMKQGRDEYWAFIQESPDDQYRQSAREKIAYLNDLIDGRAKTDPIPNPDR